MRKYVEYSANHVKFFITKLMKNSITGKTGRNFRLLDP
ncbi:unknown [Prevotella sp. CAG:485]|nr:unknown [Prevotella sp. CAG:485]